MQFAPAGHEREYAMQGLNDVYPADAAQIEALREKGPDGPVFMVNLLKFKDRAEYEDGRATTLTGRDAYQIYGRAVSEIWAGSRNCGTKSRSLLTPIVAQWCACRSRPNGERRRCIALRASKAS